MASGTKFSYSEEKTNTEDGCEFQQLDDSQGVSLVPETENQFPATYDSKPSWRRPFEKMRLWRKHVGRNLAEKFMYLWFKMNDSKMKRLQETNIFSGSMSRSDRIKFLRDLRKKWRLEFQSDKDQETYAIFSESKRMWNRTKSSNEDLTCKQALSLSSANNTQDQICALTKPISQIEHSNGLKSEEIPSFHAKPVSEKMKYKVDLDEQNTTLLSDDSTISGDEEGAVMKPKQRTVRFKVYESQGLSTAYSETLSEEEEYELAPDALTSMLSAASTLDVKNHENAIKELRHIVLCNTPDELPTVWTESSSEKISPDVNMNVPSRNQTPDAGNRKYTMEKPKLNGSYSESPSARAESWSENSEPEMNLETVIIPPPDHALASIPHLEVLARIALSGVDPWHEGMGLPRGLTTEILKSLNDEQYVVSEVVNIYFQCIQERSESNKNRLPSVYAMNDAFYPILAQGTFEDVRNATGDVDIYSKDLVLFPIHQRDHWYLIIALMEPCELVCFDSLSRCSDSYIDDLNEVLSCLTDYLSEEYVKRRGSLEIPNWTYDLGYSNDLPQQNNGFDCGVFMCKFADYVATGHLPNFTHEHIPFFRKLMVCELCAHNLSRQPYGICCFTKDLFY